MPLGRLGIDLGDHQGTEGSMRNAEELSMTKTPCLAAIGANFLEIDPPALKNAMSTPLKLFSVNSSTKSSLPRNAIFFPLEREDAKSTRSDRGKGRFSRQRKNSIPTAPVAPTTATLYFFLLIER